MKLNRNIILKKIAKFCCLTLISVIFYTPFQSVDASPPPWVENPPAQEDIYYGIGMVATRSSKAPNEDEQSKAYSYAVTELSHMAGTMIYSSFKDYQREVSGKVGNDVAEQEVVSSVKNISENFLQGIQIRDRWQDQAAKMYYVLVVIDRKDANRQIKENTASRETRLQKVINIGITNLEQRLEKMEADVGKIDVKVGKVGREMGHVKKKVGRVEENLAEVDERSKKTAKDVGDLFDQMQFVKDKIESLNTGEMNWSKGLARVKGIGLANPNFPKALQRRSAEEAARMDAQAKLVELSNDLKIKVKTISKNNMLETDTKIREYQGLLHGARQIGETVFNNDGTAEVIMEAGVD